MNLLTKSLLASALLASATSCNSSKQSAGLRQVDSLVTAIERVHVETQLADKKGNAALAILQTLASPQFVGDPLAVFTEFAAAVDDSEAHGKKLDRAIDTMRRSAGPFFEQWEKGLEAFSSPEMRLRSQTRLAETKERYEAILAAVEPTQTNYTALNAGLRDHVIFLGRDLNPSSVADIRDVTEALARLSDALQSTVELCHVACRDYVQSSALPMHIETLEKSEEGPAEWPGPVNDDTSASE